jgi:ABC-type phosphate transport system substrate-binding protein
MSALLVTTAACSLLLDHSNTQCSSDGDCAKFGDGTKCVNSLCVGPTASGDGSTADGTVPASDGATSDGTVTDGGEIMEAGVTNGFDGCFPGNPTTNNELLNACTPATCIAYDNCAHLGLCNDAALPSTIDPPEAGTASSTTIADAGGVYCYDAVNRPNVVYVTGSSNMPPFLAAVAPLLASGTPSYTIVWQQTNSCTGVNAIFNSDSTKHTIVDAPGKNTSFYYDSMGNAVPCLLGDSVGGPSAEVVDVGASDIFSSTCSTKLGYTPDPTGASTGGVPVGEYFGPIQAMTYVVPEASQQKAISAEGAHFVFGMGGGDAGLPWNDPTFMFIRNDGSGTNQILSRAMAVTPSKWWGIDKGSAGNMANQLVQVPTVAADKAIGILSDDFAITQKGNLRVLSFQAFGQQCGFLPDSTEFTNDKANVRDGHYPVWGPLHFFTSLSNGGAPSAAAGALLLRFSQSKLDQALVQAIAKIGDVPACAMHVKRTTEMGDLSAATPAYSCDCYFDFLVNGKTTCQTCAMSSECPSSRPTCNYGYCEPGN